MPTTPISFPGINPCGMVVVTETFRSVPDTVNVGAAPIAACE